MKNDIQKIIFPIGVIILMGLAFAGGVFFTKRQPSSVAIPVSSDAQNVKTYTNHQLHFSLAYPAMYDQIQESPDRVIFGIKGSEDMSGFGVLTEKTSYATTKDWLDAQAKGSALSAGYQPVFWIDGSPNGKVIVAEYLVVDRDGNKPIYDKELSAVYVQNGTVYKIPLLGQFSVNDTPSVGSDMMGIVNSFQAFIE